MNIGIDIRVMTGRRTGIGRFVGQLLNGLAAVDSNNSYVLFYNALKGEAPSDIPGKNNFKIASIKWPNKLLNIAWAYSSFPKIERFTGALDVFHAPNFQMPPVRRAASVLTIHDLVFLLHPEMAIPSSVRHFGRRMRHYVERANIVVADSNATANDIINHLGVSPERVRTVYPGATRIPKTNKDQVVSTKQKFGIGDDYILFVGAIEPRKNLIRLFQAFDISGLSSDFKLVLVGPKGWHTDKIFKTWKSLSCRDKIQWLDFVGDADLAALYSSASFLVYPSLMEGFGLPILEAMSAGCPVLTSDVSSMPEVAGDAALYVNPLDIDSIADGMKRLSGNLGLRKNLAELGQSRVEMFSWKRTAAEMIKIYEQARGIKAVRS